jgi:hypothetical protein
MIYFKVSVFETIFKFLMISTLLQFCSGCGQKEVSPDSYIKIWQAKKSSVSDTKIVDNIRMELSYLPTEILAINEMGTQIKKEEYQKGIEGYCDNIYCNLKITEDGKEANKQINVGENISSMDITKYFSKYRQEQFVGAIGEDTVRCILYQPELMSSKSIGSSINLVFTRPKSWNCQADIPDDFICLFKMDDAFLSEKDRASPESTVLRFVIKKDFIRRIPKLHL